MKKVEEKDKRRKPRSDRKRQIAPVISAELYHCLDRIAFITSTPLKDVGEKICLKGIRSRKVIDELTPFFRRDYQFENSYGDFNVIRGLSHRLPFKVNRGDEDPERIYMRFHQASHDALGALAFALDMTISSATALLLETSFELGIGHQYIEQYIQYELLDQERTEQFSAVLELINEEIAPEHLSLAELIRDYLAKDAFDQGKLLRPFLDSWISQYIEFE